MRLIQYSIRLPVNLDKALRQIATSREVSRYSVLGECVRIGLASLAGGENSSLLITEMAHEVGTMSARQAHAERLLERAIFVSTAAYCYARASVGGRIPDATIVEEINSAHLRQLKIAEGEDA